MASLCIEEVLAQRGLPADIGGRQLELTYKEGRVKRKVLATIDRATALGNNILIIRLERSRDNPFKFISFASDGSATPPNLGWFGVMADDSSVDLVDLRPIATT